MARMHRIVRALTLWCAVAIAIDSSADAANLCNGAWRNARTIDRSRGPAVGDLINLANGVILERSWDNNKYLRPSGSLSFGYVTSNVNESGAVLVKIRHRWNGNVKEETKSIQKVDFPSAKKIKLQRPSYDSPCGKGRIGPYDHDVRIDEYVDNTYFGFPDLKNSDEFSLERFHAELGYRGRSYLGFGGICETTHHRKIRGHFAYSGSGQVASREDYVLRQQARAANAVFNWNAYAEPVQYENKLHTIIVPYGAKPQEATCVSFDVPFPGEAEATDIGIVDADQALSGFAIQGNWRLNRTKQ